ncbi:hypothetical protein BX600DRAFT_448423, partial [Xylariales sp. PMI_506]
MQTTVDHDLVISTTGDPVKAGVLDKQGRFTCMQCRENLPGAFFTREMSDRQNHLVVCQGCQLGYLLDEEQDHYKIQKTNVASKLWENAPETSLDFLFGGSEQAEWNM